MKKITLITLFFSSFCYAGGVSMGYTNQLSFHTPNAKKECSYKIEDKPELKPIHRMIKI